MIKVHRGNFSNEIFLLNGNKDNDIKICNEELLAFNEHGVISYLN